MKNVHVLPHSEIGFNPKRSANIYITNDEKPKLNDWFLDTLDKVVFKVTYEDILTTQLDGLPFNFKKIILTTDQDLIKNGVQEIPDEFLEWFVKNPSCEEVEIEKILIGKVEGTTMSVSKYKIIIPKEEPKQETLEEAAERILLGEDLDLSDYDKRHILKAMVNIAKWQEEQTIEEVFEWLTTQDYLTDLKETLIENFKEFKNK